MSDFAQTLTPIPSAGSLHSRGPESPTFGLAMCIYASNGNVALTANQVIYEAVLVQDTVTVTHMGIIVYNSSSGNVDVGIYNEYGTRLVSAGSTAISTTSNSAVVQSFAVTETKLGPGVYWLAMVADNATSTFRGATSGLVGTANYATARTRGFMFQSSTFPLPATATFSAATAGVNIPEVAAMFRATF